MKIAFYILTFVVCLVASYFSLSHREIFQSQHQARLDTIETNKNVSANADGVEAEIVVRAAVLQQAEEARATAQASFDSLESTGRNIANQVSEIQNTINSQKVEIDRLTKAIADVNAMLAEFGDGITPGTISESIAALEKQRDDLLKEMQEIEEVTAAAERNLADKRAEAMRLTQRATARNNQLRLNATEAVISAVNHDWGFVLIGAGSNSGFAPESSMVVQRDGRVIGRVRPSSIEPTQTVAEIEYSTMSPGVRLQPGDRVLLARPVAN